MMQTCRSGGRGPESTGVGAWGPTCGATLDHQPESCWVFSALIYNLQPVMLVLIFELRDSVVCSLNLVEEEGSVPLFTGLF